MAAKKKSSSRKKKYQVHFLSERDAQMVGEELDKIAQANQINSINHLDPEMVFKTIENNPRHPLWRVYEKNKDKAARKHWLEYTRRLITGVRVVIANVSKRPKVEPAYYSAEAPVRKNGSTVVRRTHIASSDVLANDPIFLSALSGKLRRFVSVLRELEQLASRRPTPPDVMQLLQDVRAAVSACSIANGL
jgi:hypothetical protein